MSGINDVAFVRYLKVKTDLKENRFATNAAESFSAFKQIGKFLAVKKVMNHLVVLFP